MLSSCVFLFRLYWLNDIILCIFVWAILTQWYHPVYTCLGYIDSMISSCDTCLFYIDSMISSCVYLFGLYWLNDIIVCILVWAILTQWYHRVYTCLGYIDSKGIIVCILVCAILTQWNNLVINAWTVLTQWTILVLNYLGSIDSMK